jgi:hypothetical protein
MTELLFISIFREIHVSGNLVGGVSTKSSIFRRYPRKRIQRVLGEMLFDLHSRCRVLFLAQVPRRTTYLSFYERMVSHKVSKNRPLAVENRQQAMHTFSEDKSRRRCRIAL